MINLTDKTLTVNRNVVLVFFLICFSNVFFGQNQSEVRHKKINLLLEVCNNQSYNFCYDGYGQIKKLYPSLIGSDSTYKIEFNSIYKFLEPNQHTLHDLASLKGIKEIQFFLDSAYEIGNRKDFFCRKLKRKVNRMYRKGGIKKKFDGYFYYVPLEVNIDYIYIGKQEITMPNLNAKFFSPIEVTREMNVYTILDLQIIDSVTSP